MTEGLSCGNYPAVLVGDFRLVRAHLNSASCKGYNVYYASEDGVLTPVAGIFGKLDEGTLDDVQTAEARKVDADNVFYNYKLAIKAGDVRCTPDHELEKAEQRQKNAVENVDKAKAKVAELEKAAKDAADKLQAARTNHGGQTRRR